MEDTNVAVLRFLSTPNPPLSNITLYPPSVLPRGSWYQAQQFPLYVLQTTIALFGILTNVINITAFLKIGLTDSMTITFFSLAISDLLHLICFTIIRMLSILQYEQGIKSSIVRLQDLGGWFGWLAVYFMDVSMYITVFAAVQKSCCVALPLTFKNTFRKQRSFVAVAFIFVGTLAMFMPLYVNIVNEWLFDPVTKNYPLDWIKLNSSFEATVWRWMHRITLTIASQVIVILCLAIITAKLKQSVKFRMSGVAEKEEDTINKKHLTQETRLGGKELRAIRSVQIIALIFILTTLPSTINSLTTVLYPQISRAGHRTIVFTIQALMYFGGTLNASINIVVYFMYNTKYKTVLLGKNCCLREPLKQ